MKMRKLILLSAILIMPFSICLVNAHAETNTVTAPVINVKYPEWTNKDVTAISVIVDPLPDSLYARTDSQRDFTDITFDSNYKVKENGVIYIKAVYKTEGETQEFTRSFVIECFDKKAPTFSAVLSGTKLTITAKDDISGISSIYINEDVITEFNALTDLTAVAVYKVSSKDSSVTVFVEDNAGNLSSVQTVNINKSSSGSGSSSEAGRIGNANITLEKPEWTNQKSAYIKVKVSGQNIDSVEAKASRNAEWKSIDSNMDFKITQNTDVYVRATDTNGIVTTYSERIECFDWTAPSVSIIQDGKNINVVTIDNQSGTEIIYINGKAHRTNDGTVSVSISQNAKYMTVQAKDLAGNFSESTRFSVDQSLLGNTDNAAAEPVGANEVFTEETQTGTIYNITLSDGKQYSLEELQALGVPIYIMTGIDENTLRSIVQEVYLSQNNSEIIAYEVPAGEVALLESPEEEQIQPEISEEIEETPAVEKNKSSPLGIIIVAAVVLVLGLIAILYIKRHNAKYSKDDLYESEYDPDRNAYGDDFEDMDNPLEYDIAY